MAALKSGDLQLNVEASVILFVPDITSINNYYLWLAILMINREEFLMINFW